MERERGMEIERDMSQVLIGKGLCAREREVERERGMGRERDMRHGGRVWDDASRLDSLSAQGIVSQERGMGRKRDVCHGGRVWDDARRLYSRSARGILSLCLFFCLSLFVST